MASVIVASTSASTSTPASPSPTATSAVARSDEGNLGRENPIGSSAAAAAAATTNAKEDDNNNNPLGDRPRDPIIDEKKDGNNPRQDEQHRNEGPIQVQSQPQLVEKIRSQEVNEYNAKGLERASPAAASNATNTGKAFGEGPLPRELRRIIMEVAKTGKCSWLSWSHETLAASKQQSCAGAKGGGAATDSKAAAAAAAAVGVSKSLQKASSSSATSSSPSRYSPLLSNKSSTSSSGGVVRKQHSLGAAARRSAGLPPRKRHRNGLVHKKKNGERMRFGNADGAFAARNNSSGNSRKRPLVTANSGGNSSTAKNNNSNSSSNHNNNNINGKFGNISLNSASYSSAPSSVGSGRSTGSEPDYDSTPYECDSEGTSASEFSTRKTTKAKRSGAANTQGTQINSGLDTWTDTATVGDGEDENMSVDGSIQQGSPYKTLQTAFRGALGLVLDHFYQNRGNGYKLSPAEKKRNERFAEAFNRKNKDNKNGGDAKVRSDKLASLLSSEYVFQQRRQRLMAMLLPSNEHDKQSGEPPFTIQRIAEVLVAPDRTHKLCNCLEKLLLVNASTDSFGGSTGGDTSQRRREERELAALADEKGRQEIQLRQRRIARSRAPVDELETDDHVETLSSKAAGSSNEITNDESNPNYKTKTTTHLAGRAEKETMGTNAQSLYLSQKRSISASSDPNASREMLEALTRASLRSRFDHVGVDLQHHSSPNTSSTNEKDVRSIAENRKMTNSPPLPNVSMANHGDTNGYVRQHHPEQQQQQQQQQNEDHDMLGRYLETNATNMNILQYHHAVALAGVSLNRSNNPSSLDNLMTFDANTISQMRSQTNTAGTGPGSESTDGRSSASNSDIDSESDDISFDDSASDRSDGSDSGSTSAHHEPFTAARAMLLNRIQQQQRLQNRHQGEGFRPPADSEYQSGDSIDSTRAEDSGGSDSSSSDLAD